MTTDHDLYAEWGAAYTLGALDTADRDRFEAHLASCAICAAELAALAPLPGLIARVDAREFVGPVDPDRLVSIENRARHELAGIQRSRRRWRTTSVIAGVAAAALAIVLVLPGSDPPVAERVDAEIATSAAETTTISTTAKLWGTEIRVEVTRLPQRDSYQLWVIDTAGTWSGAASWSPTPSGGAKLTGATATPTDDIERIVITSQDRADVLIDARTT